MTKRFPYIINLCFFLYFVILIVERTISVVASIQAINMYADAFSGYVYTLIFASVVGWLIYLIVFCRDNIRGLFAPSQELSFKHLSIASGILLLSGMVHSEFTTPAIQFIAYGILIVGILLKVIMVNKDSNHKALLWLSFAYLVCLSMAIPVVYRSFIELHALFHVIECAASFALVATFTYLLLLVFDGIDDLFAWWPILLVVILDTPLVILRWQEEINYFVLIFECLSVALFVAGLICKKAKQAK